MNTASCHSRESGNPGVVGNHHWIPASAGMTNRSRLLVVELVAKVFLAFGIGLAASIALAGVVLLLAQDVQAAELQAMKPSRVQQGWRDSSLCSWRSACTPPRGGRRSP